VRGAILSQKLPVSNRKSSHGLERITTAEKTSQEREQKAGGGLGEEEIVRKKVSQRQEKG